MPSNPVRNVYGSKAALSFISLQHLPMPQHKRTVQKEYIAPLKIHKLPQVIRMNIANIHQCNLPVTADQKRRQRRAKGIPEQNQLFVPGCLRIFNGNQRKRAGQEHFIRISSHGFLHIIDWHGLPVLPVVDLAAVCRRTSQIIQVIRRKR